MNVKFSELSVRIDKLFFMCYIMGVLLNTDYEHTQEII